MKLPEFSEQELLVLALLAEGQSTKQISAGTGLSTSGAKAALRRVYQKIGAGNRSAAAAWFVDHRRQLAGDEVGRATWYWQAFVQGSFEAAATRWFGTPESDRPADVRLQVALMLLLQGHSQMAQSEAARLDGMAATLFTLVRRWLEGDHPKAVADFVHALPPASRLKRTGLLALHFVGIRLEEWTIASRAAYQLVVELEHEVSKRFVE